MEGKKRTPLNDGLDGLVDVVVDVLANDDGGDGVGVLGLVDEALVLELCLFCGEALLDFTGVAVLEVLVLDAYEVVGVHLGCDLLVHDGLDGGVEVVLVNLLVDGGSNLLMLSGDDGLVHDGRGDGLVDGRVILARLGPARRESGYARGKREDG